MTLPDHKYVDAIAVIKAQVRTIARWGSVEQTIDAIAELDLERKKLDRVQANPHLWAGRDAAMPERYIGREERARRAERERSDLSHAQDTYPPSGPSLDRRHDVV